MVGCAPSIPAVQSDFCYQTLTLISRGAENGGRAEELGVCWCPAAAALPPWLARLPIVMRKADLVEP